jgi:hypothetical protein
MLQGFQGVRSSGFCGLFETAETASAVTLKPWKLLKPNILNNYLDYILEYQAIFKTALAS